MTENYRALRTQPIAGSHVELKQLQSHNTAHQRSSSTSPRFKKSPRTGSAIKKPRMQDHSHLSISLQRWSLRTWLKSTFSCSTSSVALPATLPEVQTNLEVVVLMIRVLYASISIAIPDLQVWGLISDQKSGVSCFNICSLGRSCLDSSSRPLHLPSALTGLGTCFFTSAP